MSRIGTGLTAATLPLVVGVAFAGAGKTCAAVAFFVLTGLLVVATFAAYLPGLHRLPGIGAPRLVTTLAANGSPDLVVTIANRPNDREPPHHSILIRLGFRSKSRTDVESALLNFCAPVGHGLQICDHRGEPVEEGKAMPPTQEEQTMDYWAVEDLRLTGRNSRLFHFRIRVDAPGAYPVVVRLNSKDLYDEIVVRRTLRVREQGEADMPARDAISALIDEGERVLRAPDESLLGGESSQSMAGVFVYRVTLAIDELDRPELRKRLDEALLDYDGPQSGADYFRALVASRVRTLYDIRDLPGL